MKKNMISGYIPNYIKYFFVLGGLVLTFFVLIITQMIVKPLLAALIIALLLKPLCSLLEKIKIPRVLCSVIAILLILILLSALSFFFFSQVKDLDLEVDTVVNNFYSAINKIQQWASTHLGMEPQEQLTYIKDSSAAVLKNSMAFLQNAFAGTAGALSELFIFFVGLFFFLYYRSFLATFLFQCFKTANHHHIRTTMKSIQKMVRGYIIGLFLVILTTATLNTIGLLLLGIQHAIFFGTVAGVLTIIPYVGITIGSLLPFLFALATTDSMWYPMGVIMIFAFVQFLEGNFITPNIVGSQVRLNPFAALIALFFSGIFFGLLGIILSLPLLAMIKIILDNIDFLKPWGFLLGNPKQ